MILLKDIKRKRNKQRQKTSVRKRLFNQISSIVKRYNLANDFLDILENVEGYLYGKQSNLKRIRVKEPFNAPLFSLVTKDQYSLTMSIIHKIDNPYLKFAHSPEEIVWCGPLYRLNPSLDNEKLMRYHFETLYLHECAKAKKTESTCHKGTKTRRIFY